MADPEQSAGAMKSCGRVPTAYSDLQCKRGKRPTRAGRDSWQNQRQNKDTLGNEAFLLLSRSSLSRERRFALTWSCSVRLKTYIVEDNPTIRVNLIDTLEELAGVTTVGIAETENEGTAWLTENRDQWDLAIVDLFLKQGSGLGVLAACQGRPSNQKVVVLSNYATADVRRRCAQLGVDAVFDKSNEIDALVEFCNRQCGAAA
jgi:CheY-like chemotaxis protein